MAAGKGDAWAKDLATRMKSAGGPVWIAVGHEPENDGGDVQQWKAMQNRIGPIMRAAAPNLGFSVIVMGYHQFYGAAKFSMSAMWPKTKVDIAGFDVYEKYGVTKKAVDVTEWKNFDTGYFAQDAGLVEVLRRAVGPGRDRLQRPGREEGLGLDVEDLQEPHGPRRDRVLLLQHQPAQHRELVAEPATKKTAFTALNKSAPMHAVTEPRM